MLVAASLARGRCRLVQTRRVVGRPTKTILVHVGGFVRTPAHHMQGVPQHWVVQGYSRNTSWRLVLSIVPFRSKRIFLGGGLQESANHQVCMHEGFNPPPPFKRQQVALVYDDVAAGRDLTPSFCHQGRLAEDAPLPVIGLGSGAENLNLNRTQPLTLHRSATDHATSLINQVSTASCSFAPTLPWTRPNYDSSSASTSYV